MKKVGIVIVFFILVSGRLESNTVLSHYETVIVNVKLFDGINVLDNVNVGINNKSIFVFNTQIEFEADQIIIGQGYTLLPALMNSHVHVWAPSNLREALEAGVFALFDMHTTETAFTLLKKYNDSTKFARYLAAGPAATVPKGHGTQYGLWVPTINENVSERQFVKDRIRAEADYIKIIREPLRQTLTFNQIKALIDNTHRLNKKAVVHISNLDDAVKVSILKADGLVHIWHDRVASFEDLVTIKKNKTFVTPTMMTTKLLLDKWKDKEGVLTIDQLNNELLKTYENGIPILAGTDPPNFSLNYGTSLYQELEMLVESGMTTLDAIKAATSNISKVYNIKEYGFVRSGGPANFILVQGDPLEDIKDLYKEKRIWKNGVEIQF